MERSVLASVLVIGVVAAMLGAGTMAYFSDTEKSEGNTFTAGTLEIELDMVTEKVITATWNFPNMKPGDVICPAFIVHNAGSLTVSDILQTLEITSTAGPLDDYLVLDGFWVAVVDTKEDALTIISDPQKYIVDEPLTGYTFPDPDFNDYGRKRPISNLATTSQSLGGIDITDDGNVPGTVLPSEKYLVYIYKMEFEETDEDQNNAQGDSLELTMTLDAKQ